MKKIRLIAACIAALVVIVICFAGLSGNKGKTEVERATVHVVVAKQDIPAYSLISADMLTTADVPQDALPAGATTYGEVDDVAGSIALSDIAGNETILANHLREPSRATVTPNISKKMRAMTVGVTDVTGVSNLIRVGNKVDVYFVDEDPDHPDQIKSTLLLEDISVLALDQQVSDSKASSNGSDDSSGSSSSSSNSDTAYETVTLHVSPEQAAKLSAAAKKGTVWLALRSQDDTSDAGEADASTYDFM